MRVTTLTTLPTELIKQVLEDVWSGSDLIHMAHVCRRLREITTGHPRFAFNCRFNSYFHDLDQSSVDIQEFRTRLAHMITSCVRIKLSISAGDIRPDSTEAKLPCWSRLSRAVSIAIQHGIVVELDLQGPPCIVLAVLQACTAPAPYLAEFALFVTADHAVIPTNVFAGSAPRLITVDLRGAAALPNEPVSAFTNVARVGTTPVSMRFIENIGICFPNMDSLWIDGEERELKHDIDPHLPNLRAAQLRDIIAVTIYIDEQSIELITALAPNLEKLTFELTDNDFGDASCIDHIPDLIHHVLPRSGPICLDINDNTLICRADSDDGRRISVRFNEMSGYVSASNFAKLVETVIATLGTRVVSLTIELFVIDRFLGIVAHLLALRSAEVRLERYAPLYPWTRKKATNEESADDWARRHMKSEKTLKSNLISHNDQLELLSTSSDSGNRVRSDHLDLIISSQNVDGAEMLSKDLPVAIASALGITRRFNRVVLTLSGVCIDEKI